MIKVLGVAAPPADIVGAVAVIISRNVVLLTVSETVRTSDEAFAVYLRHPCSAIGRFILEQRKEQGFGGYGDQEVPSPDVSGTTCLPGTPNGV